MGKRVALFDNMKFVLILMVVLGHMSESYLSNSHLLKVVFIFIYSFHMPAFLFVSGLLRRPYKENDRLRREKVISYLLCALVLKAFLSFLQLLLGKREYFLLTESHLPWFLVALAAYELLACFLRNIKPGVVLLVGTLTACFVGYDNEIGDWLSLSRIIVFLPFYFAGLYLEKEKIEALSGKLWVKALSLCAVVSYACGCFFFVDKAYKLRGLFTGRNAFAKVTAIEGCGAQHRLLAMAISIVIGFAVLMLVPSKKIPVITSVGGKSMQVYCWHNLILKVLVHFGIYKTLAGIMPKGAVSIALLLIAVAVVFVTALPIFAEPYRYLLNSIVKTDTKAEK